MGRFRLRSSCFDNERRYSRDLKVRDNSGKMEWLGEVMFSSLPAATMKEDCTVCSDGDETCAVG
jgi:hypothetical protein